MKEFKDTIQKYLQERAAEDLLFAPRLANPKKSIDECCRYILGEARKRGTSVVMSDTEVFGMAVHYYDEENIEVGKFLSVAPFLLPISRTYGGRKNAARQAAIKRLTEEQYRSLKKRPAKKKLMRVSNK